MRQIVVIILLDPVCGALDVGIHTHRPEPFSRAVVHLPHALPHHLFIHHSDKVMRSSTSVHFML